jgi:hypothetical protein
VSDFFRTRAPAEFVLLGVKDLARLAHQAEDTGDDVLTLQVYDELSRREQAFPKIRFRALFREYYLESRRCRRK